MQQMRVVSASMATARPWHGVCALHVTPGFQLSVDARPLSRCSPALAMFSVLWLYACFCPLLTAAVVGGVGAGAAEIGAWAAGAGTGAGAGAGAGAGFASTGLARGAGLLAAGRTPRLPGVNRSRISVSLGCTVVLLGSSCSALV